MAMVAPYCYRCPLAQKFPDCEIACLDTSFELIDAQTTSKPAAVITEPLFSAGGVVEPPFGWLKKLKENCEERDMLLIVDDEQTGLGKLGTMFGFEKDEVVPDVVTLAKHFGGGVSISSVSTSAEVEEKIASTEFVVTHSHTNDPLACAAGVASLDVIEGEDVPAKARKIGAHLRERLTWLGERTPWLITKFGASRFDRVSYEDEDVLLLGNENTGLPDAWHTRWPERRIYVPMPGPIRSYNLANTAAVVLAQAFVQLNDAEVTNHGGGRDPIG